jgi:ATP-dependent protease ClpP protease subunit
MKKKFNFLFNLAIAALLAFIPYKAYKSISKVEYLDSNFDIHIGGINFYSAEGILKSLKDARVKRNKSKVITMGINSPGGSVHAGIEIISEMKFLQEKGYKFKCYVSNAYSMGFIILGFCDERIGKSTSTFMHHLTQVGYNRPERTERNKKLFKALDFFDSLFTKDLEKRLKLKGKKLYDIIKEDKWWSAKSALEDGIIDRVENFSFYTKKYKFKVNFLEASNVRKKINN